MKKVIVVMIIAMTAAQGFCQPTPFQKGKGQIAAERKDSMIIEDIIKPEEEKAASQQRNPDWEMLRATIKLKYGATAADRAVTKSRIYYYYGKDWELFSTDLVKYTIWWESPDDLRVLNKNAMMILQYSKKWKEWEAAAEWAKMAYESDSTNAEYKATYDALNAKLHAN